MGIMPQGGTRPPRVDLSHLAVSHHFGPDGERVQIRDRHTDAALVATFTPEAAAAVSACLDRGRPGVAEFAVQLDRAVAGAVYAMVARVHDGGAR